MTQIKCEKKNDGGMKTNAGTFQLGMTISQTNWLNRKSHTAF